MPDTTAGDAGTGYPTAYPSNYVPKITLKGWEVRGGPPDGPARAIAQPGAAHALILLHGQHGARGCRSKTLIPGADPCFPNTPGTVTVQLAALFMIFLLITVAWDVLVGVLTFLNNVLRGRKASWLARVKEELLALGVVSLVLLFLEVRGGPAGPASHGTNDHGRAVLLRSTSNPRTEIKDERRVYVMQPVRHACLSAQKHRQPGH